jgi:hypothetical protein
MKAHQEKQSSVSFTHLPASQSVCQLSIVLVTAQAGNRQLRIAESRVPYRRLQWDLLWTERKKWQISLRGFRFSSVTIITPMLYIH